MSNKPPCKYRQNQKQNKSLNQVTLVNIILLLKTNSNSKLAQLDLPSIFNSFTVFLEG